MLEKHSNMQDACRRTNKNKQKFTHSHSSITSFSAFILYLLLVLLRKDEFRKFEGWDVKISRISKNLNLKLKSRNKTISYFVIFYKT